MHAEGKAPSWPHGFEGGQGFWWLFEGRRVTGTTAALAAQRAISRSPLAALAFVADRFGIEP